MSDISDEAMRLAVPIPLRAKAMLLEAELVEAATNIAFLHGCLTEPNTFKYTSPEQSEEQVKRISELVALTSMLPKEGGMCFHSLHEEECTECQGTAQRAWLLRQAHDVLMSEPHEC